MSFKVTIPPLLRLAAISAVAAGLAYGIGNWFPEGYIAPIPAAITAVVVTSSTASRAWKMSLIQVLGIAVGAVLALIAVAYLGYSALTIMFLVLSSFGIVFILKRVKGINPPAAAASIATSVIIILGSHLSTNDAFDRFFGVLAGAIIGLIGSLFTSSNSNLEQLSARIDDLFDDVSRLSADISQGLAHKGFNNVGNWYDEAITIRDKYRHESDVITELDESSKWTPFMSENEADRLRKRYNSLGMTITRILAITSDMKVAEDKHLFDDTPTGVLTPLSRLFGDVSQTLDTDVPSSSRADITDSAAETIRAASNSDLSAIDFGVISGLTQNARRLVSLEDTQPLPISDTPNLTSSPPCA